MGVAGGLGERPGRPGQRRLRRGAVGVQRGLRPGAGRARAQAGPGAGLRARRRGGRSPRRCTGPARAPTPTTWRRPPSAWPGSAPRAATSPGRSRRWTWCRRPAAATPRPGGCGPCTSTSPGRVCRRWPRRWRACRAYRWTRATQAELTARDPGAGPGRGRAGPDRKTGVTIGPYAARDDSLRDGLEATYRTLAGDRDRRAPALRAGRQGQRRAKVDPAMTDQPTPEPTHAAAADPTAASAVAADAGASARPAAQPLTPTDALRTEAGPRRRRLRRHR